MAKISFTVSARTARLIGRENVSNAEGAIIELVKNSYDADAKICIVYFDNKYIEIPSQLEKDEFKSLLKEISDENLLTSSYRLDGEVYLFKNAFLACPLFRFSGPTGIIFFYSPCVFFFFYVIIFSRIEILRLPNRLKRISGRKRSQRRGLKDGHKSRRKPTWRKKNY